MATYRIMVRGEDHTEFCYKNNVDQEDVEEKIATAKEIYCGKVWAEREHEIRDIDLFPEHLDDPMYGEY